MWHSDLSWNLRGFLGSLTNLQLRIWLGLLQSKPTVNEEGLQLLGNKLVFLCLQFFPSKFKNPYFVICVHDFELSTSFWKVRLSLRFVKVISRVLKNRGMACKASCAWWWLKTIMEMRVSHTRSLVKHLKLLTLEDSPQCQWTFSRFLLSQQGNQSVSSEVWYQSSLCARGRAWWYSTLPLSGSCHCVGSAGVPWMRCN